jgi:hypothetical protein
MHWVVKLHQMVFNSIVSDINKIHYRVYKKKLNRFEIALNFAKQLLVSSLFIYIYIASLGIYVE